MTLKDNLANALNFFTSPATQKEENMLITEITPKNKRDLLELFVAFYGEKHRDYIVDTLSSVKFIFPSQMTEDDMQNFDIDERIKSSFMDGLKEFKSSLSDAQAYCNGYLDKNGNFQKCVVLSGKYNDHQLIHELNHVLEMRFLEKCKDSFKYFSGFDIVEEKFNVQTTEDEREFTEFNEVVNENITKRILEKKKEMGIEFSPYKDESSGYFWGEKISQKFIDYFMHDLMKCRITGQPYKFKKLIGEDNFNKISSNIKLIMSKNDFEIVVLRDKIETIVGKKLNNSSDLVKYSEYLSTLDLDEESKKYFKTITDFKNTTSLVIEQDKEYEQY